MDNQKHSGHRQRMYQRYLLSSDEGFADHELLEMLLFGALPRVNTNGIAHDLISHFGSLDAVLDADINALLSVKGINNASAIHIKLVSSLWRRYSKLKAEKSSPVFDREVIGKMLVDTYRMVSVERVTLLLFDSSAKLISTKILSEGSVNSSDINIRRIAELSLACGASYIALAHNHPGGKADPSDTDMTSTRLVKRSLEMIDLPLIEHFIVAGDDDCTLLS